MTTKEDTAGFSVNAPTAEVIAPDGYGLGAPSDKELGVRLRNILRCNAQLFEDMTGGLGRLNMRLHDQLSALMEFALQLQGKPVTATEVVPINEVMLQAENVRKLMRINAQMFEDTARALGEQNTALFEQVSARTAELLLFLRPSIVIEACSKQ